MVLSDGPAASVTLASGEILVLHKTWCGPALVPALRNAGFGWRALSEGLRQAARGRPGKASQRFPRDLGRPGRLARRSESSPGLFGRGTQHRAANRLIATSSHFWPAHVAGTVAPGQVAEENPREPSGTRSSSKAEREAEAARRLRRNLKRGDQTLALPTPTISSLRLGNRLPQCRRSFSLPLVSGRRLRVLSRLPHWSMPPSDCPTGHNPRLLLSVSSPGPPGQRRWEAALAAVEALPLAQYLERKKCRVDEGRETGMADGGGAAGIGGCGARGSGAYKVGPKPGPRLVRPPTCHRTLPCSLDPWRSFNSFAVIFSEPLASPAQVPLDDFRMTVLPPARAGAPEAEDQTQEAETNDSPLPETSRNLAGSADDQGEGETRDTGMRRQQAHESQFGVGAESGASLQPPPDGPVQVEVEAGGDPGTSAPLPTRSCSGKNPEKISQHHRLIAGEWTAACAFGSSPASICLSRTAGGLPPPDFILATNTAGAVVEIRLFAAGPFRDEPGGGSPGRHSGHVEASGTCEVIAKLQLEGVGELFRCRATAHLGGLQEGGLRDERLPSRSVAFYLLFPNADPFRISQHRCHRPGP